MLPYGSFWMDHEDNGILAWAVNENYKRALSSMCYKLLLINSDVIEKASVLLSLFYVGNKAFISIAMSGNFDAQLTSGSLNTLGIHDWSAHEKL